MEVLPLTMVNLLQKINSETLLQESATVWQGTSTGGNTSLSQSVTEEDAVTTSNSDTGTDHSEHGELVPEPLRQNDHEDEFGNNGMEKLIASEGSPGILQLTLQEQADNFMNEEITDADDYADWLRWVADAEQGRRTRRESTPDTVATLVLQQTYPTDISSIPTLLQAAQVKGDDFSCTTTGPSSSYCHDEVGNRWREVS